MCKVITVFFSRRGYNYCNSSIQYLERGNTEIAAEMIHSAVGGDLFEIETARPYAEDYRECCQEAAAELSSNARPELKAYVEDMDQYDTIFVGYPNWCGTVPMCVRTFLEHYDLSGKYIAPLCTNEGSGLAHSMKDLADSCPGAVILPGLSVHGSSIRDSGQKIASWAKEMAQRSKNIEK